MDFKNMTCWEFTALVRHVEGMNKKLVAFYDALERGNGEQAALDEYERAHNELERALTTISVRQRFAAQDRKEAERRAKMHFEHPRLAQVLA